MDNLFDYSYENEKKKQQPLASRMRPETLDEVVGQKHIIGKDRLLYRAIRADRLFIHYFLWTSWNRENDNGTRHSEYFILRIFSGKCNHSR